MFLPVVQCQETKDFDYCVSAPSYLVNYSGFCLSGQYGGTAGLANLLISDQVFQSYFSVYACGSFVSADPGPVGEKKKLKHGWLSPNNTLNQLTCCLVPCHVYTCAGFIANVHLKCCGIFIEAIFHFGLLSLNCLWDSVRGVKRSCF